MKKLSAILTLTATSFVAQAQLQKGSWMLGTTIGSTGITRSDDFFSGSVANFSLTPRVGRFVTDRLVLGAGITGSYTRYKDVYTLPSRVQTATVGITPFARYYFAGKKSNDVVGRLVPFVEAGVGTFAVRNWATVGTEAYNTGWGQGFNAYFAPGASYFISPNVAAEARVNFDYTGGPAVSTSTGVSLELGFQIFLNRSKRKTSPSAER